MRQFTVSFTAPKECDCCGKAIKPFVPRNRTLVGPKRRSAQRLEPGKWQIVEGATAVEYRLGNAIKISLGGGTLKVSIATSRTSLKGRRGWDLKRLYNTDAFGHAKKEFVADMADTSEPGWYTFSFKFPAEFKPWYATWWAQLEFVEVVPFTTTPQGHLVEAHSPAKLTIKLETLE